MAGRCIRMSTNKMKARYISDIKSIFLKKGEIYEVWPVKDDKRFLAFYLEDMDEPGEYALPANRFEIIEE